MITIALIGPGKPSGQHAAAAVDLYTSELTRMRLRYAREILHLRDEHIFFISAQHGLINIDRIVIPIDRDIRSLESAEKARWAAMVKRSVRQSFNTLGKVVVLAGVHYRSPLVDMLAALPRVEVLTPLNGMESGQQIDYFVGVLSPR